MFNPKYEASPPKFCTFLPSLANFADLHEDAVVDVEPRARALHDPLPRERPPEAHDHALVPGVPDGRHLAAVRFV